MPPSPDDIRQHHDDQSADPVDDQQDQGQVQALVGLYEDTDTLLFHDQLNDSYAYFPGRKGPMLRRISSEDFAHWLRWLYYQETGDAIGEKALQKVVNLCACRAKFDGPEHALYNRIALSGDDIVYNLCDDAGQVVHISKDGYKIEQQEVPLYRYYRHQRPQITPADDGSIRELLPFINLKANCKDMELLLLVYLVSCFIPEYPHVILTVSGEKGSAKSTLLRVIRRLVDPAKPLLLSLPEKLDDLPLQLDQNYYSPYDNVTDFSKKISDRLCRASTGEGDSKRKLYTDDDPFLREYLRCVALDGINVCAKEPDLLDRCLLIELERIPKDKRRVEKEFWKEFEKASPRILYGIFRTLSKAISLHGIVDHPPGLNRMADFEEWGWAIAVALGYTAAEFSAAYERNIGVQTQVAIDENDVAQCIVELMEREEGCRWEGTAAELLEVLTDIAIEKKIDTKDKSWPKRHSTLSKHIRGILSNLRDVGIQVTFNRDGHARTVIIEKAGNPPSSVVTDKKVSSESQNVGDNTLDMVAAVFGEPSQDSLQQEAKIMDGDRNDSAAV